MGAMLPITGVFPMVYQNLSPIFFAFIDRMSLNDMHQIHTAVKNK